MKVLYDHQAFEMQKFGGVSNSFVKLIEELPKEIEYNIAIKESDNVHLKESAIAVSAPLKCGPGNFITSSHFMGQGRLYELYSKLFPRFTSYGRNKLYAIDTLIKGEFDIFHPTFFETYFLPYLKGKPFVLTVHDMIPELYFPRRDLQVRTKPILCEKAAHIVVVSKKTKQDLVEMLHVPEEKVTVIYHGAPSSCTNSFSKRQIQGRYILYVGQRGLYKNFFPMLKSLLPIFQNYPDIKLVCTGPNFSKKEKQCFQSWGVKDKIVHIYVSDTELYNLYANALCFIYPSAYEGFGIPILEAYRANCPVLLNHSSCFPEIALNAAVYFHLDDNTSDLTRVMNDFLHMTTKEREELIDKQQKRMMAFSWKESAKKLADVYTSIL